MAIVPLQTAVPIDERVRAAYKQFNQTVDVETLVAFGMVLVVILAVFFFLGKLYLSRVKERYGYSDDYLRKRKKFD